MAYITAMQADKSQKLKLRSLKKRADFLRMRSGEFARPKGFYLQAMPNGGDDTRVGFTASKKIGNAVTRNRAKRRLRAVAQDVIGARGMQGWDYVLIAKNDITTSRPYEDLVKDAKWALHQVHPS